MRIENWNAAEIRVSSALIQVFLKELGTSTEVFDQKRRSSGGYWKVYLPNKEKEASH
jgi:hypothetical protein